MPDSGEVAGPPLMTAEDSALVQRQLAETQPPPEFHSPLTATSVDYWNAQLKLAGPSWLLPSPAMVGGGDLADWISLVPGYDVDDGPGVGQTRYFTHWGIVTRNADWQIDGQPESWQRLSFPQYPQFDAGILPSFIFSHYTAGESVVLDRDTAWSAEANSSYFYRQGNYADTYSEGQFRRLIGRRLGIDLDFTFFDSDGRFAYDTRDTRHLRFQAVGPIINDIMWRAQFTQFRDKTRVLTPTPFTAVSPTRDDLLWTLDFATYRPGIESGGWITGLRIQSGKQSLRDRFIPYHLLSKDQHWSLWTRRAVAGWNLTASGELETFDMDSTSVDRWNVGGTMEHDWTLADSWSVIALLGVREYDTDPLGVTATLLIHPIEPAIPWVPSVRLERSRVLPSLFDRHRPRADRLFSVLSFADSIVYAESGRPELDAQWNNSIAVYWQMGKREDRHPRLTVEGRAAYIERYIRWQDTASVPTLSYHAPVTDDVRTVGFGAGIDAPLFGNFTVITHYAAQYAETIDGTRLPDFYPHKANLILNWNRPKIRWNVDLEGNIIAVWWYADRRINPTNYDQPHVFRLDLSGSATLADFRFYYLVQNLFNFQYRTRAGYPMTGRTVRFGIDWHFLN